MNKTSLKSLLACAALLASGSAMAVGLGVNAGVKADVPGLSVNSNANANAQGNVDLKGKSSAAVKGAKSKGDEMRSEAGALHSEAKGEVGKRTGQLESAAPAGVNINANAEVKANGKVKADKK